MLFKKLFQKAKPVQLKNQVELCVSNKLYDSEEVEILLNRQDIDVIEVGCNSHCEVCDADFYALVNGEMIRAATVKDLLARIEEELVASAVM